MKKSGVFYNIKRELHIAKEEKSFCLYIFIVIKAICGGLVPFIGILLSKVIIDSLTLGQGNDLIIKTVIIICSIGAVFAIVDAIFKNLFQGWFMDVRLKEFNKVNNIFTRMDYENLENAAFRNEYKVAFSALDGDYMGFQHILTLVTELSTLFVSLIVYCVYIGIFNIWILLSCFVSAIIVVFVNKKIADYIASKKVERAKYERQEEYYQRISYDFSYSKDIRVYSLQGKLLKDYHNKGNGVISIIANIANKRFGYGLLEVLALLLENAVSYYLIIDSYLKGNITLGQVSMYISIVVAFSETIRQLTDKVTDLIKDSKYVDSYFEMMDRKDLFGTSGTKKAFDKNEQIEIEFKNVSFKYPQTDRWIIRNFNFKIEKGQKLAIVGLNGAGKSTIVKLINGLFYPNEGEILLNGINIKEFDKEELLKMFSTVYQEVNIVAASVIENIVGLDKSQEARERAINCLERVGLKEKIESLEFGYDTQLLKVIDDKGVELSGGQNQKIAIARALYKDGNVVILDEPTSALDALAEGAIYQSFDDLVKNKTAIYISHRLSSTKFCDKIALFTQEGLKEYGTHEELMALKQEYYHMFETQGKYYREGDGTNEEQN